MNNFRELMATKGIPCVGEGEHEHGRQGWLNVDCVYCSPGIRHFRLGFNLSRRYWSCWSCGWHPLWETLARILQISIQDARKVAEGLGSSEPLRARQNRNLGVPRGVGDLLGPHRRYLEGRGFDSDELVSIWRIGGIGLASKLQWRIYIPAFLGEEQVSWTTRSISDSGLRYISAGANQESYSIKRILYGEEHCKNAIIVCEGPLDAWKIGPGAVATCGTGYSQEQMSRMVKYPLRVICFDREAAAQTRAKKLFNSLAVFPGETLNVLLSAKDAAEAPMSEIKELRSMLR